MELHGAVTLITGASSGIGAATAEAVAAAGGRPVLVGRDGNRLEEVARRTGGLPIVADLSDADGVTTTVEQALAAAGRVDVLINNAGIGWAGRLTSMTDEQMHRLVAVNLLAPLRLTRLLTPQMIERGRGHVVFVTSIAGYAGVRGEAVYSAAKGGLAVFADAVRHELAGTGVGVSVLVPGVVDTAFFTRRGVPYRRSWPRPQSPARAAAAIVAAVVDERAEVFTPAWMRIAARVHGAAPALFRMLAARWG